MQVLVLLALTAGVWSKNLNLDGYMKRIGLLRESCYSANIPCSSITKQFPFSSTSLTQFYGLFNTCQKPTGQQFSKISPTEDVLCFEVSLRAITVYSRPPGSRCLQIEYGNSSFDSQQRETGLPSPTELHLTISRRRSIIEISYAVSELRFDTIKIMTKSIEYSDELNFTCYLGNIAYGKETHQRAEVLSRSSNAVNGIVNASCDFVKGFSEQRNWWRVDLDTPRLIRRLKIYCHNSPIFALEQISYFLSDSSTPDTVPSNQSSDWQFVRYHHGSYGQIAIEDFEPALELRHFPIVANSVSFLHMQEVMLFDATRVVLEYDNFVIQCPVNLRFGSSYTIFAQTYFNGSNLPPFKRFSKVSNFRAPTGPKILRVLPIFPKGRNSDLYLKVVVVSSPLTYCNSLVLECYTKSQQELCFQNETTTSLCDRNNISEGGHEEVLLVKNKDLKSSYVIYAKLRSKTGTLSPPSSFHLTIPSVHGSSNLDQDVNSAVTSSVDNDKPQLGYSIEVISGVCGVLVLASVLALGWTRMLFSTKKKRIKPQPTKDQNNSATYCLRRKPKPPTTV